jgi:hypothetical protein
MKRLLLVAAVVLCWTAAAFGQGARTAERIVEIPFSRLNEGNPPDSSVRVLLNGTPGTTPCISGAVKVFAIKLNGEWQCPKLSPGVGTGDMVGASASAAGELMVFADTSGKSAGRSNTLNGIPFLISGVVSALASTGTGNVVRAASATLTTPTLITPTIGAFDNAQHTHESATAGGRLNASNVFSSGVVPPERLISGALTNNRCLRLSNVGQIEVAAEDCGSGGGGTPGGVSGNLAFNESGSFGGVSNSAYNSVTGRLTLNQKANSNDTFYSQRFTDTTPTGSFLKFRSADGSTDLFLVSTDGGVFSSSRLTSKNIAAPALPSAGNTVVWTDLTDKNLKTQDDAGNVSITLRPVACSGTDKISAISSAGVVTCSADQGGAGTGVITLNTLTTSDQSFVMVDDANIDLSISSSVSTHTFTVAWLGTLGKNRQHPETMYTGQSNTVTTGNQSFAAALTLTIPTAAGASPTTSAQVAYDSTSNTWEAGINGTNRTFAFTTGSQTLSDKTLDNSTAANLRDTSLTIQDNADSTKTVNFELSAIASATNRVVSIPNADSVTVQPTTVTTNQFVTHIDSSGVVQKAQPSFANLIGSLSEAQGGTGQTSYAQGDMLFASAANTLSKLNKSTSATRYIANTGASNNPLWDQVNLTNGVSGVLPADNGGSGNAFFQVSGPSGSVKTYTFPNTSTTVLTTNAAVTVPQGGTGLTSGTSGGVPYFNSSSTIASSAALATNQLVLGGGAGAAPATLGSLGTTTTVLHGNAAGAPSFGPIVNADIQNATIDLTTKVTGLLPGANGGTNNGFTQFTGPATSLKTFTLPNSSATILTDAALVTGAQGGTNNAFFQVSGPATSLKTFAFPNASATVLTDNAAVTIAQGGTGQTTQTAAFNALDPLTTKGDVLAHDGTNSVRVPPGTNGFALIADSTQTAGVRWGAITASAPGADTQLIRNSGGSLAAITGATSDGTAVTFSAGNVIIGSIASAPTPALGKLYVDSDDGKLYFGIDGTNWGEIYIAGKSIVNLALWGTDPLTANVTNILPPSATEHTINAQTGTSYTVVDGDRGKLIAQSNAGAIAYTLPNAAGAGFDAGWYVAIQNRGAGTVTITPTTSTIDGAASLALTQNQGAWIFSDGTNYFTQRGIGGGGGGTPGGSDTQIQFNDGGAFGGDAGLTYNKTTDTLTVAGAIALSASGAGYIELAEGTAPTVVANRLTFAAPVDVPASGLVYILPSDTPTNGEQLTANISGTTVTLSWDAAGAGGSGDAVSVNGSAATDANFINTAASGTVPSITWSLNTGATPDEISISAIGAASTTEAGIITTGTQSLAGAKLLGHTAALGRSGQTFEVTTSADYGGVALNTFSSTAVEAGILDFNRSKSATKGTQTVVAADDALGHVAFRGSDGTNFENAALILGSVDGTPGNDDMPGRISFFTTPDGSVATTERWRINSAGHFLAATDNAIDIGASGANRPRSVYVATSLITPIVTWTGSVQDRSGSGTPEGAVTAAIGSVYRRTDGGASTTLYVKESGAGNTGWVAYGAGGGGGSGTINSGATNTIPKYVGATTIDDSLLSDDGTTLTYSGTGGLSLTASGGGFLQLTEGTPPSIVANTVQHAVVADAPAAGTQYLWGAAAGSGVLRVTNSSGVMTVTQDAGISHLAASTSADLAGVLSNETGTGVVVFGTTPTITFANTGLTVQDTDASHLLTIAPGSDLTANRTLTITTGDAARTIDISGGNLTLAGAFTTSGANALTLTTTGSTNVTLPTSGTLVASGGDIGAGTATTPSANDNDTSIATTAYVQSELSAYASDTKTLTNATYDTSATGNVFTSTFVIEAPAAGCSGTTASSFWDLPTTTPAVAACVTGTNTQKAYLDFADTSGGFSAQYNFRLAADFTGTIDAHVTWLTTATSGNVEWSLSTICVATDATETDDPAFNTASTVVTAAPGVANRLQTSTITSVTITGCAAGEWIYAKIFRDGNDAQDTLGATARLKGVQFVLRRAQ